MAAEIGNRLSENSKPRDVWTHRGEHPRARSSRPSNLFRFASVFASCRTLCADAGEARTALRRRAYTAMCRRYFVKHRDKHWRDILQKIFRFVALENGGVLPQLIGDLVNDKLAVRLKRIVRLSQQCALLLDLENAKRNAGENVIARNESAAFQLVRQRGRIAMNHMHASIACKLPFQCSRQRRVEFKQEQMRIRCHSSRDLTRVHAFARAVLRDRPRLGEIHFAGDTFHHRLRTGYNRGDLKRTLQETLEKECTHGSSDVRLRHLGCLVLMCTCEQQRRCLTDY